MVVVLAFAFILELVAFAGFAAISFILPLSPVLQTILCILLLIGLITFWSLFMAPKAVKKFSITLYYIAKVIIYAIAAFTMFHLWSVGFAIVFVVLSLIDEAILFRHNLEK